MIVQVDARTCIYYVYCCLYMGYVGIAAFNEKTLNP